MLTSLKRRLSAAHEPNRAGRLRTWWARVHYVWVRLGVFMLVAMPIAAYFTFRAQGLPGDTWQETADVSVERDEVYLGFRALNPVSPESRLILVPGCPVETAAYAPLARRLAVRGFSAFVVNVPYRCAPYAPQIATLRERIATVIRTCPSCEWTIVGHSRGAAHALDIASAMPDRIAGLVLLGSTHPREKNFSRLRIPVMKVLATNDGVAPRSASEANRRLLPPSVRWEVVDGGNHSQFAYYGFQLFDGRATISRQEQHVRVVQAIASFLGPDD